MSRCRIAALTLALAACSKDLLAPDAPPPPADAAIDADKLVFETTEVTTDNGQIVIERITYRSGGLLIVGQICRPFGPGPFPVYISNHGGFAGIGDWNGAPCADVAAGGVVLAESSYRGEDGLQGAVEVCAGEVDDVLRLTQLVLAQPYADPGRVAMFGASHGGCVTTRAVQRGAPVSAAVDIFGPTDLAAAYAFWQAAIAGGSPDAATYQTLVQIVEAGTGGSPTTAPEAYEARSPRSFVADLDAFGGPFMIVHGTSDGLVPVGQSCDLATAAVGFEAYHLDVMGVEAAAAPAGCEAASLTWQAGPRPRPAWPGDRYLVVYDGAGHGFEGTAGAAMLDDVLGFLVAKLP